MSKGASYGLVAVVVVVLAALGAYAYVTAPTKAPSMVMETASTTDRGAMMMASGSAMTAPVADGKYHIVADQSKASFTLNELLRGQPVTVVGTTSQVEGAFQVDRTNLAALKLDPIRINARTFVTDSEMRNNAIRRMILKTENDSNEFMVFTPTNVSGTPATIAIGQSFPFQVTGDLLVSGTTKSVTFNGTATFSADDQLSGSVQTKIHYPDFGVTVPNLPFLANVDQDTTLKLDFIAKK